ncbi:MAG: 3-dehydroquinate synthase [Deltaproteobacteria bacterium]|nr:3-dehydroquinate synthase [Deltaproteobacteria bacterium]
MQTVRVNCPSGRLPAYDITIGAGALAKLLKLSRASQHTKCVVVLDGGIEERWREPIDNVMRELGAPYAGVITVPGGEECKTIEILSGLWTKFHALMLDRKSLVINVGGGAVTDLGGLAASTFMRGMNFVNVPTTLLAQVDASVGGKLAINFCEVKNLIGVFEQPKAVIADTEFLSTLPERELIAGFAEVIKHGLIKDSAYLSLLTSRPDSFLSNEWLEKIVTGSCKIKAEVVAADETESGLRKILNFGHTIGHAVELLSHHTDSPLLHGEAISIGMAAEGYLSVEAGLLPKNEFKMLEELLKAYKLPIKLGAPLDESALLEKTRSDKKNVGGKTKWTLLKAIGEAVYDIELSEKQVENSIRYILDA